MKQSDTATINSAESAGRSNLLTLSDQCTSEGDIPRDDWSVNQDTAEHIEILSLKYTFVSVVNNTAQKKEAAHKRNQANLNCLFPMETVCLILTETTVISLQDRTIPEHVFHHRVPV